MNSDNTGFVNDTALLLRCPQLSLNLRGRVWKNRHQVQPSAAQVEILEQWCLPSPGLDLSLRGSSESDWLARCSPALSTVSFDTGHD